MKSIIALLPTYYIAYCKDSFGDIWTFREDPSWKIAPVIAISVHGTHHMLHYTLADLKRLRKKILACPPEFWEQTLSDNATHRLKKSTLRFERIMAARYRLDTHTFYSKQHNLPGF
jgi:hypothetical protein